MTCSTDLSKLAFATSALTNVVTSFEMCLSRRELRGAGRRIVRGSGGAGMSVQKIPCSGSMSSHQCAPLS